MTPSIYDTGHDASDTPPPNRPDVLAQVRAYWEGLRDGDEIPLRSQFDPRGIEGALSSAFLLERVAPGLARFRIAGMGLADLMGMELRGMPLSALFCAESRDRLATALEQVFDKPAILTMSLTAEWGFAKPALKARLLVLPLRSDRGAQGLALGCLALEGNIGRSPRRFNINSHALMQLTRKTADEPAPWPREGAFTPLTVPADRRPKDMAFAEPARAYDGNGQGKSVPYLRLVKSDG